MALTSEKVGFFGTLEGKTRRSKGLGVPVFHPRNWLLLEPLHSVKGLGCAGGARFCQILPVSEKKLADKSRLSYDEDNTKGGAEMKTLLVAILMVTATWASADRAPDFLRLYDILEIEYHVTDKGDTGNWAWYMIATDDIYMTRAALMRTDPRIVARTVVHELVHWSNWRPQRAPLGHSKILDLYYNEAVAIMAGHELGLFLWGGDYAMTAESAVEYLLGHFEHRVLTQAELAEVKADIRESVRFLLRHIKKLDTKNELGLQ